MVDEISRATLAGNIQNLCQKYPYFVETVLAQCGVPGMGRVIADIKSSQTDEFNHRVMAIPLVAGMISKLAHGNAQILGYDLELSPGASREVERDSSIDAVLSVQAGHGATKNLKPGLHVVKVSHTDVFNKKLVLIDSQTEEEKTFFDSLRQKGFQLAGHIVVRSGPRFANSHTMNVTEDNDFRVWEINMRLDFAELAEQSSTVAPSDIEPGVIDQLLQNSNESLESILKAAGAWEPIRRKSVLVELKSRASAAAVKLNDLRKHKQSSAGVSKSISIGKLDRALKKFIPGNDPEAVAGRDVYIDATNKLNRTWFYQSVVGANDLRSACRMFEDRLVAESNKMADEFFEGKLKKRSASRFIKYLNRLNILEELKTRAVEIEKEIMREYFELRETPAWREHKRTLDRGRWFMVKLEKQMAMVRQAEKEVRQAELDQG